RRRRGGGVVVVEALRQTYDGAQGPAVDRGVGRERREDAARRDLDVVALAMTQVVCHEVTGPRRAAPGKSSVSPAGSLGLVRGLVFGLRSSARRRRDVL